MSIAKKCKIDNCNRRGVLNSNGKRYLAKGMCNMHYRRVYTYGQEATMPTRFTARPATIDGEIALLPLGVGAKDGYATVDIEYSQLDVYKWYKSKAGYVCANTGSKIEYLHRIILETDTHVDHANRDKLDNRKANLRPATRSQNMTNTKTRAKSGYRGVHRANWIKSERWRATISKEGKIYHIGLFSNPVEAAMAYNKMATKLHGEFAVLNIIDKEI